MNDNIASLETRLTNIENEVLSVRQELYRIKGDQPVVPVTRTAVAAPQPVSPPAQAPARTFDLEQFFGGRFLLGAGGLAFLLGIAFFLKYAFDNGWIGPTGRVAMGLIGGIALIFVSELALRSGRRYYAEALAGLGTGVLYLSLWAAGSFFHLLPLAVTFVAMSVVTAAIMAISVRRDTERLAFVALVGGFLTPVLNAGGPTDLTTLFGYLAILGSALLWLAHVRWPRLEIAALAGTQLYLLIEMPQAGTFTAWSHAQAITLIFATIFLLQYSFIPFVRARRTGELRSYECIIVAVSATLYYLVLYNQLYGLERHALSAITVALAAGYLGLAYGSRAFARWTFAAIALSLVTIGVGITFTGETAAIVWSIEGAVLVLAGVRGDSLVSRIFGYLAFLCTIAHLPVALIDGGALFANPRFATLVTLSAALGAVAWAAKDGFANHLETERHLGPTAEALAHLSFLAALGFEISHLFHGSELSISLLMLAYATALVIAGFAAKRNFTRWEGLALFGALAAKVFLIDLSSLDAIVRIVSFLAVGTVLLVIALAYQRRQARGEQT